MKKLLELGIAMAVVFAVASPAIARPLNWEGTLSSVIAELPDLTAIGGGVATVNGSTGPIPAHLEDIRIQGGRARLNTVTDTVFVTDPETAGNGIAAIIIDYELGTGTIGPVSGAIRSTSALAKRRLPIGGLARICLLSNACTQFLDLDLTQATTNGARHQSNPPTTSPAMSPSKFTPAGNQGLKIGIDGTGRKGIGIGGLITVGGFSAIRISVEAAPWTVKTATAVDQTDDNNGTAAFHNVTGMGFAHGPASLTTSTAQPSGVLQIVTPSQIRTNLSLGSSVKLSVITELLIHFIPEPGLLLLLGSGVVGLAVLGRNRMKS